MSRKTMRPTNVRASVGSSASGSESSAIVRVPPSFRAGAAEERADAPTPAASASTSAAPIAARTRVSLMLFPLSVSYNENYVRLAALAGARHPKLDPNGRQMDTKVVTVPRNAEPHALHGGHARGLAVPAGPARPPAGRDRRRGRGPLRPARRRWRNRDDSP